MRGIGPLSSTMGMAMVRDFKTMSIGFSRIVSIALTGLTAASRVSSACRRCSLIVVDVMSASGVLGRSPEGSGDAEGFGVGSGTSSSGVAALDVLAATLLRFRGEGFFTGSSWSAVAVRSGSRISLASEGAILFFGRPRLLGVAGGSMVLRLLCRRGLLLSATGLNSSSLSSAIFCVVSAAISSSSESITAVLRVAARREGRVDDMTAGGVRRKGQ